MLRGNGAAIGRQRRNDLTQPPIESSKPFKRRKREGGKGGKEGGTRRRRREEEGEEEVGRARYVI